VANHVAFTNERRRKHVLKNLSACGAACVRWHERRKRVVSGELAAAIQELEENKQATEASALNIPESIFAFDRVRIRQRSSFFAAKHVPAKSGPHTNSGALILPMRALSNDGDGAVDIAGVKGEEEAFDSGVAEADVKKEISVRGHGEFVGHDSALGGKGSLCERAIRGPHMRDEAAHRWCRRRVCVTFVLALQHPLRPARERALPPRDRVIADALGERTSTVILLSLLLALRHQRQPSPHPHHRTLFQGRLTVTEFWLFRRTFACLP
jgi:hypothetical protein